MISFDTTTTSAAGCWPFVSLSSFSGRSDDGRRCLRRARDRVAFNSVCSWFLMAPSDDLVPAGDVLCLFGGKKSNFVGSGRTS